MNCKETILDLVTSIEAYPFSGVSFIGTMSVHTKSVSEADLGLREMEMFRIPMKDKSCNLSENSSSEIPGDSYEVTAAWQIRHVDEGVYQILERLKENPNHLIFRTYGGNGYFVRCEEEGYSFSYTESGGLIECELKIHNRNGMQRIL